MQEAARPAAAAHTVDNTDWLKTAGIVFASIDHIGYFFIEHELWWSVFGRLAAPTFFFLMGYARTRAVPLYWIWLGIVLTLLDSWNADWTWVAPNILLSFALIRISLPHVRRFAQHGGWAVFALLVSALLALLPAAAKIVDYGAEGWLWALFGFYQRQHADEPSAGLGRGTRKSPPAAHPAVGDAGLMRHVACFVAAVVYVWQEQMEFSFPPIHFAVLVLGVGLLSLSFCRFLRGPSRIQPPDAIACALRFIGRRTLEIYAIQLAGSELIIKLVPDLAP